MLRRCSTLLVPTAHPSTAAAAQVKQRTTKLQFANSREAHGRKSLFELLLRVSVMKSMRFSCITDNAQSIINKCEKVFGEYLTYQVGVRSTFFRVFCGGEYIHELTQTAEDLHAQHIGAISDFAAEAPETTGEKVIMRGMTAISTDASIPYTQAPEKFDDTMALNLLCITNAHVMIRKVGRGFAAIKLSGLCEPMLLARVSALMLATRQAWVGFYGVQLPLEECRVVVGLALPDRHQDVKAVRAGLQQQVKRANLSLTQEEEDNIIRCLDPDGTGKVDYLHFTSVVTEAMLNRFSTTASALAPLMATLPQLTQHELEMWKALEHRVGTILDIAARLNVLVTVDAEQSFFQMAIDYVVRCNQAKYNRERPMIYNTYQCYLTYATQRLHNDIARAQREGWIWAGKMVRGAYLETERKTASHNAYKSPIWSSIEETHACYNGCANHILDIIAANPTTKIGVLFGSHNPETIKLVADKVADLPENSSSISCAQLLGMADHLTVSLSRAGIVVFKYVPYGPVKETIQYLIRRAQENRDVLAGVRPEEWTMLVTELKRRLSGGRRDK